ncbi:ABSCISIC ACID-INSENSITIVE 5-like protein 2 [Bidens hawaiensis]|uniref:ABSCISIC ACID-INSENSITIVE 5-like protein 2 n=1 Tax=Bidens hawaiensis TaxID=980011 RepID=UPI00404B4B0B
MGSNGEPKSDGLGRQSSMYDLTLDEVQHQLGDLGKPFTSMNLDELLNSISNSSLNLTQDLRKKTVDEVWRGIQQGRQNNNSNNNHNNNSSSKNNDDDRERQLTLGEMTLEDFLVKAGKVAGSGTKNVDSNQQWMQYQVQPIQQQQVYVPVHHPGQQSLTIGANPMMDLGYSETTQVTLSDTQTPGRKRVASGDVMEKTVERRQKRMIKNRESAARSRARKQAYTHELENKISRLEGENERLKRQKEVGMVLPSAPPPKPKYQLRRTSSASF